MSHTAKPSPSIVATAVVAILCGLLVLIVTSIGFLGILLRPFPGTSPELPPFARTAGLAVMAFMMCLSIFGVITGIALFLLRNWARISLLIWGGFSVFFGAVGIPIAFLVPLTPPQNTPELPAESMQAVRWILLFGYGLPLFIGIWWLVLFNRKAIKAQFAPTTTSANSNLPQKPRCPLPITVLAWFYISTAANAVLLPVLPFSIPMILFGRVIPGVAGTVLLSLSCALVMLAGVGLLKLKQWSYALTIGLQLFWLSSSVATFLNPNYESIITSFMTSIYKAMHLCPGFYSSAGYLHHFRWTMYSALLGPVAITVLLLYYRKRFLEAASAASSS